MALARGGAQSAAQTEDGQRLKWLPICDEFSRESVALEVERRMESADVIRILDAAVAERGTEPDSIRSDNGPEFIAADVPAWYSGSALCIFQGAVKCFCICTQFDK